MDKTSINIGLSKQIENICESIKVHTQGVKDFHLYSSLTEIHADLDRIIDDSFKLKRLSIKFYNERK